mmetsp:Transcript_13033/g.27424  ORF Transcript_13033/g.27424 Transcript_13033/m.27424 type:complete len:232 (-) Transcript_13033:91-786(-)
MMEAKPPCPMIRTGSYASCASRGHSEGVSIVVVAAAAVAVAVASRECPAGPDQGNHAPVVDLLGVGRIGVLRVRVRIENAQEVPELGGAGGTVAGHAHGASLQALQEFVGGLRRIVAVPVAATVRVVVVLVVGGGGQQLARDHFHQFVVVAAVAAVAAVVVAVVPLQQQRVQRIAAALRTDQDFDRNVSFQECRHGFSPESSRGAQDRYPWWWLHVHLHLRVHVHCCGGCR